MKLCSTHGAWSFTLGVGMATRRTFYPEIEPYQTGFLQVSGEHWIYYEESGNPAGKPVVFLHGGPGGGTSPKQRRFFDPDALPDRALRSAGLRHEPARTLRSATTPPGTWSRTSSACAKQLGIERWQVFGGSWGSTLALAYSEKHPERVSELVLRGIFLLRRWELDWFYQSGTSRLFPEAWRAYEELIPPGRARRFRGCVSPAADQPRPQSIRQEAARVWSVWEASTSHLYPDRRLRSQLRGRRLQPGLRSDRGPLLRESWLSRA